MRVILYIGWRNYIVPRKKWRRAWSKTPGLDAQSFEITCVQKNSEQSTDPPISFRKKTLFTELSPISYKDCKLNLLSIDTG